MFFDFFKNFCLLKGEYWVLAVFQSLSIFEPFTKHIHELVIERNFSTVKYFWPNSVNCSFNFLHCSSRFILQLHNFFVCLLAKSGYVCTLDAKIL